MSQQTINIGTADKGDGDPLRIAFTKVNSNFAELYNHVSAGVTSGDTAPTDPGEGDLWWDSVSGRLFVFYNTWVDASPVDGVGISSTNELVNGAHTVTLETTGTLTMPDGLTIASSVIGYNSSDTITEETPGGTVSQTTVQESQIEIDDTSVVIARRTTQTVDDTVVTTTDIASNTLGVNNSSAFMKRLADPEGPTNSSYFQVSTSNSGAVIEGVDETVGGTSFGRVTAAQGAVEILTSDSTITNGWSFIGAEITFNGDSGSYIIDGSSNNFEVRSGNNINFEAFNEASIYTRDGEKQWIFNNNGDLVLPAKWPVNFVAVFDFDHYTGPGEFTGDGTASLTVGLAGAGTNFAWAADDPVYETALGYVGQQAFSFTAADHGITGYTLDIVMELVDGGDGYVFNLVSMSPGPSVVDLAKIRSSDELMIKAGSKAWLFDLNGDIYLPPMGDIRDYAGNTVLGPYSSLVNGNSKVELNASGGTNVYLTPTTDDSTAVFINDISVQAYAKESVSLQVGAGLNDLSATHALLEAEWVNAREADAFMAAPTIREWQGLESWLAYPILLNSSPDLDPPMAPNLPTIANAAKNAYNLWQNTKSDTTISMAVGDKVWVLDPDGKITFPDNTVQTTAYPGITNSAGPSATIAVGNGSATRDQLSVRVSNNTDTLDVEINYSNPDNQVAVSAYKSYPVAANIYAGRTLKAANNTTWDLVGNLPLAGDSLSFTFTDHSSLKMYRVTVVADVMPGGGALGEAFCIIEELK